MVKPVQRCLHRFHGLASWSLVSILLVGCGDTGPTSAGTESERQVEKPSPTGSKPQLEEPSAYGGREEYYFRTAREMAVASDVIVVGTVTSIDPGRSVGDPGGTVDYVNVQLSVERTVKGLTSPVESITFEFRPMPPIGDLGGYPPFEPESPWWRPGSTSLFFLGFTTSVGLHPINSQAVYFLPGGPGGALQATKPHDDVGAEIDGRTVSELLNYLGLADN